MILRDDEIQALKVAASAGNVNEYWMAKNNIMRRLAGNEQAQKEAEAEIAEHIADRIKVDGASLVNAIKAADTNKTAIDRIVWLLQQGANVRAQDDKGKIPLIAALNIKNRDMRVYVCSLLTQYGADWDQKPNLALILADADKNRAFKISPRQYASVLETDVRKTHNIEPDYSLLRSAPPSQGQQGSNPPQQPQYQPQPQAEDPFAWLRPFIANIQNENYLTNQQIANEMNYLQRTYPDARYPEYQEAVKLYTFLLAEQNRRQAQQLQYQQLQGQQGWNQPSQQPRFVDVGGPLRGEWLSRHKEFMNDPHSLPAPVLDNAINFLGQALREGRSPYDGAAEELMALQAEQNRRQSLRAGPASVVLPPVVSPSPLPSMGSSPSPAPQPAEANLDEVKKTIQKIRLGQYNPFTPYKDAVEGVQAAERNEEKEKQEQEEAGFYSWFKW